jgi:hypothetical protein
MHRRSGTARRLTIGAAAVAAAAGGMAVARRRGGGGPRAARTPTVDADQRYTCDCGATYGVSGAGRHRVFWPADGAPADAVLEDHCPACDRPWPAEETLTAA